MSFWGYLWGYAKSAAMECGGIFAQCGGILGAEGNPVALTDLRVRNAKPKVKAYKLTDQRGLYLLVTPTGGKHWRCKYRFGGSEKLLALGSYPLITLSAAREAHTEARRKLAEGIDPSAEKRKEKEQAQDKAEPRVLDPFKDVAWQWFEKWKAGKDEKYVANTETRLEEGVLSKIGDRPIDEIQAPEIVQMICAIEARGAHDVARRAHQTTSQIFRFGIAHGLCKQNPAAMFQPGDVLKRVAPENFSRVDASELPVLLQKIEYYDGSPVTRLALKLMALTFLRTSELIKGEWSEVNLKEARWDLPKEKMKGGKRPHIVPLSPQSIAVLEELWVYRKNDRWMFAGERLNRWMSNNTLLKALERMGYKGKMTGHGFRGVASTLLHENGFEHEHIELQLAHVPENDVSAAYNYAKYLEPRRKMMKWWADYLDELLEEGKSSSSIRVKQPSVAAAAS